jgi:hypothetical protein
MALLASSPATTRLVQIRLRRWTPLNVGISPAVQGILNQYPAANENSGDGSNTLGYRFASNADSGFNTYIARLDYHITSNGSETLFARGEAQNFKEPGTQQFPGQSAATTTLDDSKGITIGLTSLLNPRLINDFRWGFIRQGGKTGGNNLDPGIYLDGIDDLVPFAPGQRSITFFVPVNQFTENLNWTHNNHTFQFGTDLFLIRNNHLSYQNSFSDARTNAVYLNTGGIAGTSSPLDPGNNGYPAVDGNFGPNYDSAATIVMGIFPEGDGIYNFARNGSALPQGRRSIDGMPLTTMSFSGRIRGA